MFRIHTASLPCTIVAAMIAAGATAAEDVATDDGWDMSLAIGANVNRGNTETLGVNAALAVARAGDTMEYRFGVEAHYGENTTTDADGSADTEKTAQNAKATANIKRRRGASYLYSDNSILHDEIGGIDYRTIVGLGAGTYLLDNDKDKLGVESGLAHIFDKFESGVDEDRVALRLAARHDHTFTEDAACWASVAYLPRLDDLADYLLNAELGGEAALNSTLSLRVVMQNRYDSEPLEELEDNDLAVIGALVYKL